MAVNYVFRPGQRVRHKYYRCTGEVTTCVPGNGSFPWYYVKWDDADITNPFTGDDERYTAEELEPI